jgi:hypothetical protein
MTRCNFIDFDIILRGAAPPYSVAARYRRQSAEGAFACDINQGDWPSLAERIERTMFTPDARLLADAGSRLFTALIHNDVRDLWIAARSDLDQERIDGLRIRLALHPPAVAALPWETLYDPHRRQAIAANGRTPLVRVEDSQRLVQPPRPLRIAWPITILLAAPDDASGQINAAAEIQAVKRLLEGFGPDRIRVTTLTGRFSILDLREQLDALKPDILHLITHGGPEGLELWQQGQSVMTPSASLQTVLEHASSVKLAFLNACLAGASTGNLPLQSVAGRLLQTGLPAVIAMQTEIRDDAAIHFAKSLYEELTAGACPGAIDAAVALARSSLFALNPGDFSYATPVLWLNAADGLIFTTAGDPGTPVRADENVAINAERRWLVQIAQEVDPSRLPPDQRFVARDWKRILSDLHGLLDQLRYVQLHGSAGAYQDKARQYQARKAALLRLQNYIDELPK